MNIIKSALFAASLIVGSLSLFAQTQTSPVIEVSGTSSISIVPDRITIEIGIEEYFKQSGADSVKVELKTIESDVRSVLLNAGVADSLITVKDLGNYGNRDRSAKFLMAKRLSAVLVDFSQLDEIAQSLPDLGVGSFLISKLDNSDMARYNKDGLKAALDAARSKAEFIAGNEKLKGLTVWKVEETTPGYAMPQAFSNVAYQGGAGMDSMRRIERQYSVRVTYLLLPE